MVRPCFIRECNHLICLDCLQNEELKDKFSKLSCEDCKYDYEKKYHSSKTVDKDFQKKLATGYPERFAQAQIEARNYSTRADNSVTKRGAQDEFVD